MKGMSYRDKMICLIILIIIILVLGFFFAIKPAYDKLVADTATHEETQKTWDGIKQKLEAIEPLQDTVTEIRNEGNETAQIFVNEVFASANDTYDVQKVGYTVDQHIQAAIDKGELRVDSMQISEVSSEQLTYYYYAPNVVTYSLLEAADINGKYAVAVEEAMNADTVLTSEEKATAEVQTISVEMTVKGQKEGLMTFLDEIKSDKNAVLVSTVNVDDYKFQLPEEEDGEQETLPEGEGWSTMSLVVKFYNAKAIDTPDIDYVIENSDMAATEAAG